MTDATWTPLPDGEVETRTERMLAPILALVRGENGEGRDARGGGPPPLAAQGMGHPSEWPDGSQPLPHGCGSDQPQPLPYGRGSERGHPGDVEAAIAGLRDEVALVLREHQGMADELLRVYEYMRVVFDLTPRLLALRCEGEVVDLLVCNLRSMFSETQFTVLCGGSEKAVDGVPQAVDICGDFESIPDWMSPAVLDSRRKRRVHVISQLYEPEAKFDHHRLNTDRALIVPVFAGDDFVCQVVLWRRAGAVGWESGDMMLLDSLSTFCGDVIRNFRLVRELQDMSMETVRTLVNAVDQKDPYTSGHSTRVGYYATLLGRELGFDKEQLRVLEWSALLHDVGKIGIREAVLNKPGKLTDEEFEHIKGHPLRGYEVVRENPHMREAVDGVRYHHERYDGRGYPEGLQGEAIPLQARVIQVADIFDALTTTRSYRDAYSWTEALDILTKESGKVVDPGLCDTFIKMMHRFQARNPRAFEQIGRPVSRLSLEES